MKKPLLFFFFFTGLCLAVAAQIRLPGIIADSMVLQRSMAVPVWGRASPGEKISVKGSWPKAVMASATTGADSRWIVKIMTPAAGGPYEVVIQGDAGDVDNRDAAKGAAMKGAPSQAGETIVLHGVLIGEVWICSGQSNMQMPLQGWDNSPLKDSKEELAAAHYPDIRLFTVDRNLSFAPKVDVGGNWSPCTPGSAASFSAAGYFFGRALAYKLKVPIGLISSNWGGTVAEAWTSAGALRKLGDFDAALDKVDSIRQYATGDRRFGIMAVKPYGALDYSVNTASVLYNGMIAPLIPFAIRGVIWYQGESNVGRATQYEKLFPLMITDWRTRWSEGDFPFYFVQIAPFKYSGDSTAAAALRDAQRKTMTLPNTGMVVTSDIGDITNIHPANKQEVGRRLSLWALALTYGEKGFGYSGPLYKRIQVRGNTIAVSFTHAEGGLTVHGGELTGFEIAGADGQFVSAKATIQGEQVLVLSDAVTHPVSVRYDWYAMALASLFNRAGLPAPSFSTEPTGNATPIVNPASAVSATPAGNATSAQTNYASLDHKNDWTHHYALGSPSWDAFERFPNNPVFKGRNGMEWPVNGFLFKDPQKGSWYLYIGEYRENYLAEPGNATKDMNCVIYKSDDRGSSWKLIGDLFKANQPVYDSLEIEAPDVMIVYADHKYHMIFDFVSSKDTWANMNQSGIGYAVADRPEGPFMISPKPLRMNTDYKDSPFEGRYSRVYAPMIVKRKKDWVMLHMMDSPPGWALAMATANRPEGPYSESKLVLQVETKTNYPALQEFFPAFFDEQYVYLPATSVALNRNYQSVFRVKPEDLGNPEKYETFAAGSFWHSVNLPDEHSGIWGQTISGLIDGDTLYAMYPSKDLRNYGTINLAKAPWPGIYKKNGFQLGANAGKTFSYIKRPTRLRDLQMDFKMDGTMYLVWDFHTPIDLQNAWGKFDLERNARHKQLQINSKGWDLRIGDRVNGLVSKASGQWNASSQWQSSGQRTSPNAGNNRLRIEKKGNEYLFSLNGSFFWQGEIPEDPGPVGIYLDENSHVAVDSFLLTGERVDGSVTVGFYDALVTSGDKDSSWSFVNDPHFIYGRGAVSKHTGAFAKWNFEGRAVQLCLPKGPPFGKVNVFLDGKLVKTLSLNSPGWRKSSALFSAGDLSEKPHAIYLQVVEGLLPLDCIRVTL